MVKRQNLLLTERKKVGKAHECVGVCGDGGGDVGEGGMRST